MAVRAPTDLIDELVHQFTDPFAFYRELIQNSIDAGSNRIEVSLAYQPAAKRPMCTAVVADWGEGMSRKVIEDFFLTKFRSSKEDDATKIGKYGIGFVSVFACKPDAVTVDTGKDGEFWRVLFKADRTHELLRLDAPVDGTRITLHKAMDPKDYDAFSESSAAAVRKWCRHSEVDVALSVGKSDGSPGPSAASVREPFQVDAPLQVEHREEGLHVVVGVPRQQLSLGLYNRGLTLLESHEEIVPGVSVKAIARALEHTLTRDNVRRDKNFARVVKVARQLADGPLKDKLPEALRRAAADPNGKLDWLALYLYAHQRLPPTQLWLRRPEGGALEGRAIARLIADQTLWVAEKRTALVDRLDAAGIPVLEALPTEPWVQVVRQHFDGKDVGVAEEAWTHAEPVAVDTAPAFSAALAEALKLLEARAKAVALTRLHGACSTQPFALVHALGKPVQKFAALQSPFARGAAPTLVLNTAHKDFDRLAPLLNAAPRLAAMLVCRRVAVHFGALHPDADRTLTGWALR
jgi:Histidine kinase-, DNA gyrase B-, and HSP90-like ATPase